MDMFSVVQTSAADELFVAPLKLRTRQEYLEFQRLRDDAFTPWLKSHPPRVVYNLLAKMFEGFLLEARSKSGEVAGYVFSAPAFWSGDPSELHTYDYHMKTLYRRLPIKIAALGCVGPLRAFERQLRKAQLRGSNCIVLLAMLVRSEYRGRRIPMRFIGHLKEVAASKGYRFVIAPFRPSGYGRYKEQTRKAHSAALFCDYCYSTGPEGLPIDPWLRTLVQNGMTLVRPEVRSMQVTRDLGEFERLRKTFRAGRWYKTSENTWECGETPTWYTNPFTETATSVEPNIWGMIAV